MQRHLYPKNWEEISRRIRKRSRGRCECEGFCALHRGKRCTERNGRKARYAAGNVVLTTAHLTHNTMDSRPKYLKAMCQRCHLRYDVLLKNRLRSDAKENKTVDENGDFFKIWRREAMKNLDDILDQFLKDYIAWTNNGDKTIFQVQEEAKSAIIELVKGCVPEKQEVVGDILDKYCQGHNYCRQQMLDNLERL